MDDLIHSVIETTISDYRLKRRTQPGMTGNPEAQDDTRLLAEAIAQGLIAAGYTISRGE